MVKQHAAQPAAKKGPRFEVIPDVFEDGALLYADGVLPVEYDGLYDRNEEPEHFFEGDTNLDKTGAHAGFRKLFEKLKALC